MAEAVQFEIFRGDRKEHPGADAAISDAQPRWLKEEGDYIADTPLIEAVNIALCVGQPLLLTGEPGCGKTSLAAAVARELVLGPPLVYSTKSTSRAQDVLYRYDATGRFNDIQAGRAERATEAMNYIKWEALGAAIVAQARKVVLIDEIDKAPRDFPNDLLHEIDEMSFTVPELEKAEQVKQTPIRPIVIITSNSERTLPLPFLRRCVFHYIAFPDKDRLKEIIGERLGKTGKLTLDWKLVAAAVDRFFEVRRVPGLFKVPATSELLAWVLALHVAKKTEAEVRAKDLPSLPLIQALVKNQDDHGRLRPLRTAAI